MGETGGYVIVTDSSCNLPPEMAAQLRLQVMPLGFSIGGQRYRSYLDGREMSGQTFYRLLRQGQAASTFAPGREVIRGYLEPILKNGEDILILSFSSALSATYQNCLAAASQAAEEYPERVIRCVDTRCASLGQGLLVCLAAQQRDNGMDLEQLTAYVQATGQKICHWFTLDTSEPLQSGGRASGLNLSVGPHLHAKPILRVDEYGCLVGSEKVRGRKAAIAALAEKAASLATGQSIFISHSDCEEEAQELAQRVRGVLRPRQVVISSIDPVIGSHVGPGCLALFFAGERR